MLDWRGREPIRWALSYQIPHFPQKCHLIIGNRKIRFMRNFRLILAWLVILLSVGYQVWQWGDTPELPPQIAERSLSMEERVLLFQTKAILGAKDALGEFLVGSSPVVVQSAWQSYHQGITQVVAPIFDDASVELDSSKYKALLRDKIILALRLGDYGRVGTLIQTLNLANKSSEEDSFDKIFLEIVNRQMIDLDPTISEDESIALETQLLDFSKFLQVKLVGKSFELAPEVRSEVKTSAARFFVGIIVALCLIGLSGLFFIFYSWLFLTGGTKLLYKKSGLPKYLPFETFALYLLAMLFAPKLIHYLMSQGYITNILVANVFFITSTLIILLWPVIWGQPIFTMRQAYGMYFDSIKGFIKNIFVAPTFYLSSWVVFATGLVLYGFLLRYLNIDVEKGAHPIVPLLLSSKDSNTPLLILLLATVVAPFIEEIMFRGALYSGLRSYFKAPFAIVSSALLFAAIHPQGAIGMLPLTLIGMFLAFLREWRGSLVAPMLAHACVNGGTLIIVTQLMK